MFFALTELEHHPILFDLNYPAGEVEFGEELRQRGELHVAGKAELLQHTLGEIRVRGRVDVDFDCNCDRCLEPATENLHADFDLFYRPVPKVYAHVETQLEEGEVDVSFYEGDGVELEAVLHEFVIVSQPMQHLCKPECKGLCPHCGVNRNTKECGCEGIVVDKKLAKLKQL
jgi:uncharacterized protein